MEELEVGVWYRIKEDQYLMIDPVTDGFWMVESDRDEDDGSLDSLLNFTLSCGKERPLRGQVCGMLRPPSR